MSPGPPAAAWRHGAGADGMAPAAMLEAWIWQAAPLRVTFGGLPPRGSREWRVAVWLAVAAEAARRAAEEEAGHPLPPWSG